jgi:hypothetical protein
VVARQLIAQLEHELLLLSSDEAKAALDGNVINPAALPSSSNVLFDLDQALLRNVYVPRVH